MRGGAGFDAVEGKTGIKGGAGRLQLQLSEDALLKRGNEKTQPAGWVFSDEQQKAPVTQRGCGVPVDAHARSCPT
ncbi:MAG TPA: hypothetical protein VN156_04045, partial [Pseudomonas sp.]|nr:hypothetical protein [Pseudomonas sp.]